MTSFLPDIDDVLQEAGGIVASILGQGFDVYRVGPTSSGTGVVSTQNQIAANVPVVFERTTKAKDIEINLMGKILVFRADIDVRPYQIGDVFVERSDTVRPDLSVFTLAYDRPLHDPLFVFTPIYGTIRRPNRNPLGIDSGAVPMQTQMADSDYIITLEDGLFSFQPDSGMFATIPMCIQGNERKGEYPPRDTGLYDDVRMQQWDIYVPLLNGTVIIENDVIVGANGDKYRVHMPFPQFAGFQGQILRCEKRRD